METYIKSRRTELVNALNSHLQRKQDAQDVVDKSTKVIEAAKTALNELDMVETSWNEQKAEKAPEEADQPPAEFPKQPD